MLRGVTLTPTIQFISPRKLGELGHARRETQSAVDIESGSLGY